jgi:ergothioneine biosynthesis protein EgtB
MNRAELLASYQHVRHTTEQICEPLLTEDYVVQSMPDVSPPKWHLGHTTWFFEQVVLQQFSPAYKPVAPRYSFVFNSYYESFGERVAREMRGSLSRPSVEEVKRYREGVDERMSALITTAADDNYQDFSPVVELGINHEQQHQELLIMDIKHILATNPLRPVYRVRAKSRQVSAAPAVAYVPFKGGIVNVGATDQGFAYDNERPRHQVLLQDFLLMSRLVTCGEYMEFMNAGGYSEPLLWFADGWDAVRREQWRAPLYWQQREGQWETMTLHGPRIIGPTEPVAHVSFYEAAAFARWAGKRLPTEFEWEHAAAAMDAPAACGNFLESGNLHPVPAGQMPESDRASVSQMFGDLWEWTASAYLPYPRYRQERGPLGEYNGKFMSNQMVLRGGCCATPRSHIRTSYRNFYQCDKRWLFSGIRLADEIV